MGAWRPEVHRLAFGGAVALAVSASCSGESTLGAPERLGNAASAGRSGAATGGTAGSPGRSGRGGRPSGVGGSVTAGDAGAAGDRGMAGAAADAGDGSGAVGGSQAARGGSGNVDAGGQGGEPGLCGYVHLDELEVCTTPGDRYTHVPAAVDVAACEVACSDSDHCAGIAWAAPEARCATLNQACPGVDLPLPGTPRVYSKICDDGGNCELVDGGMRTCYAPEPVLGATDLAACEAACLADASCETLVTYFDLVQPAGCYLVTHCNKPSVQPELVQQSYQRVCDLVAEDRFRPPARLALGRQHSCLRLTNGAAQCWGANAHVTFDYDDSFVVQDTLGLEGGPFTRLAATEWDTCGIGTAHDVTCTADYGLDIAVDVADLDGSNNRTSFIALRTDGRVNGRGDSGWVRAAQGGHVSCLLGGDGHVDCSGSINSADDRLTDPSGRFVRVAAGDRFACGVRVDQTLECWGDDTFGQTSPPAGTFSDVTAGTAHACGLATNGTIACWGKNTLGQATPPAGQFAEVVAAFDHNCAIPSGSNDLVTCWGEDDGFQSSPPWELRSGVGAFVQWTAAGGVGFDGVYWTEDTDEDPARYWGPVPLPVQACGLDQDGVIHCFGSAGSPPSGGGFTQLAAGVGSTCALSSSGIECWGLPYDPAWGPLAESPLNGVFRAGAFTSVSTGWDLACAVREDATLDCWGPEASGPLAPPGEFSSVAAGGAHRRWARHACGVRHDATITCWSYDDLTDELGIPYDVTGSFKAVAVGYTIDCAIDGDGHLHCWDSELGPASDPADAFPVPEGDFTLVAAGDRQACALRTNGSITCFTVVGSTGHVVLDGEYPGPFFGLSMGGDYACGLLDDGRPRCWGSYVE